jgi:hypothetical protein
MKTPPHSIEAEQATLGAILVRPEVMEKVADLISPDDFYRQAHGRIFQAMLDLYGKNEPVDLVTVSALLKERGKLEGVGGPVFLAGLSEQVGFATNAEYYAHQVHDKAVLRRLLDCTQEIASACLAPVENIGDFLQLAESRIFDVTNSNGFRKQKRPEIERVILELSEFLKTSIPSRKIYLKPWVWESFIALISAWRGVGKSGFTMALLNALSRGEAFGPWESLHAVPCLYFDAEMTMQDTRERFQDIYSETTTKETLFIFSDHLATSLGAPAANLLDERWRAWMKDEVLLKRGVKLWALDNIGAVTPGLDENATKEWSPINRWLLDLRFAGIASILVHHEGKSGSQRGASGKEDNLDISISLKRPPGYRPEDGARFIVHFEKSRIRNADLHLVADTEFQMQTDPEGKTVWTWKNVKQENKAQALKMLDEGLSRKEIAEILGISGPRVTQIKNEAVKNGHITEAGKLTQTGYEYLLKGG